MVKCTSGIEYEIPSDTWRAMERGVNPVPVPVIGLGSGDDSGPHTAFIIIGIVVGALVATIPRRPLPDGCTHAAIISPLCNMNC